MKAAFAQFLSLRHGGSGFVFGYGSGLPGQNRRRSTPAIPTPRPQLPHQPDPGRPAVPLAVVPGHRLHADASRGAAAVALHGPDGEHPGSRCGPRPIPPARLAHQPPTTRTTRASGIDRSTRASPRRPLSRPGARSGARPRSRGQDDSVRAAPGHSGPSPVPAAGRQHSLQRQRYGRPVPELPHPDGRDRRTPARFRWSTSRRLSTTW